MYMGCLTFTDCTDLLSITVNILVDEGVGSLRCIVDVGVTDGVGLASVCVLALCWDEVDT